MKTFFSVSLPYSLASHVNDFHFSMKSEDRFRCFLPPTTKNTAALLCSTTPTSLISHHHHHFHERVLFLLPDAPTLFVFQRFLRGSTLKIVKNKTKKLTFIQLPCHLDLKAQAVYVQK